MHTSFFMKCISFKLLLLLKLQEWHKRTRLPVVCLAFRKGEFWTATGIKINFFFEVILFIYPLLLTFCQCLTRRQPLILFIDASKIWFPIIYYSDKLLQGIITTMFMSNYYYSISIHKLVTHLYNLACLLFEQVYLSCILL